MIETNLEGLYKQRYEMVLKELAKRLEENLKSSLEGCPRIDRIVARAKTPARFIDKANKIEEGHLKYIEPLNQIQDQIGARVITFYLSDVETVSKCVEDYYSSIERKLIIPDDENEFGYEGKHYILFLPTDLLTPELPEEHCPRFFELQIKTLFEHSWAEANHDIAYKPSSKLSKEQRRKIAFTAAQAWGADMIFDELHKEITTEN
jgi:ppGpp synthetase/RelA/SpoT-type nucleotidyltranferase